MKAKENTPSTDGESSRLSAGAEPECSIVILDNDGKVAAWNAEAERMLGYPSMEIIDRHFSNFYTPEDKGAGKPAQHLEVAARNGRCDAAGDLVRKDGSRLRADLTITAMRDASGRLAGFAKLARDRSGRNGAGKESQPAPSASVPRGQDSAADIMRLRKELRMGEARHRAIVNALSVIVWTIDPEGKTHESAPPWHEYTGLPKEEVRGMDWVKALHPEDREAAKAKAQVASTTFQPYVHEFRVRRADGQTRHLAARGAPVKDDDGRVVEWTGVFMDVTEMKSAEILLSAVTNNVMDGIIGIDERGIIESINQSATAQFGYKDWELLGQNIKMLMPEPHSSEHDDHIRNYTHTGKAKIIGTARQVMARRKDGSTFPVELGVSEYLVDGKRHFTGVIKDISERRKLEEQLRHSQKMEAVGVLAGGVAHDFNNLLTIISGYSDILLAMLPPEDPKRASVKAISEAGERAAGLTRQLLAFSRKTIMEPKVIDINALVRDSEKMLRRMIGEDVLLTAVLAPGLCRVKADAGQLGQVLMNLSVNSRDAMPQGGRLTIETANIDLDETYARANPDIRPGRHALLAISDTGVGMSQEVQRRIFEPFFTTKGEGKGTGLGLSVAHGIIRQNHGHISVYSQPGMGTTFKIYLPAVDEHVSPAQGSEAPGAHQGSETILLVEDEDGVREIAMLTLRSKGYTVLPASSGAEALRLLADHGAPIDLLVTDVVMPGMSGRELGETLRSLQPQLRMLYLSGYTDDAVVRHGIIQADVAFLQKPFTPSVLLGKVRQVLGDKK